jgi:murein DD-endopeptidase MepM/ murein hydrolase activator NlpD
MQRTSANKIIASFSRLNFPSWKSGVKTLVLCTALFGGAVLIFQAGKNSVTVPPQLQNEITDLQYEIQLQQGKLYRLSRHNEHNINALAARLAELQAASTRMDALGERLAQMGQLTLDEFDFGEPAPIGGPAEYEAANSADEADLQFAVAALSDKLRRQSIQLDALQFLMANRQLENELTPTGWPVKKGWISSRFGERNDPFTGELAQHAGLDFAGTRGSEVLSVASGVVIWAAKRAGYGSTVEIDHGNGYQTRYAHNEEMQVNAGDHVTAGQVIALMGDSGRASSPHVHFEVLRNGVRINPSKFVGQLR